ncbi:hypothetical protein HHK36_011158 [Tetracentron sinense]|uniref:RBR-type E3 ubiquitin transferase n=1 Tax=Tetracentron sinense TaxID=13715 RepID=A0A834Z8P1_TETSI|nr:hypothetical protein HHK36_011158 [Tetracentron sinense]
MADKDLESDLDLAFRLQMQEALAASLVLQPSQSSTSSAPPPLMEPQLFDDQISNFARLQTLEYEKSHQERKDRERSEAEMRRISNDLKRRVFDQKFAQEILRMPQEVWENDGDNFERPFGEGSSTPVIDEPFRLYFKGLVSDKVQLLPGIMMVNKIALSGIGVAICDPSDNLIFKVQKPLMGNGMSIRTAEIKALIEGLNAALSLDIKRINFYCNYYPLHQFVTGRWQVKQHKIAILMNQVFLLQRKFMSCQPVFVARNDVKFAFKLARDAIDSQITSSVESTGSGSLRENCSICLEDTDVSQMFAVDVCLHRYCFSCMTQHVEVKLLHGMVPECPHENCTTKLQISSCGKFLPAKLSEMMSERIKEASVPAAEKLYCPYPRCSELMSKNEVLEYAKSLFIGPDRSGVRKCIKCHGLFCINCKVPWHSNMSCNDYRRLNPPARAEDAKLKSLATQKLWRQCVKCNHMIELAEGCFHMTCRCGYEFCYTCGAEWKNKKATCSCPLWNQRNILHEEDDEEEEEEEEEEEGYYDEGYFQERYYDGRYFDSDSDDEWNW